jgi:hypothetical protein
MTSGRVRPKVSVVVTSRNDDHGKHLARRTQMFIDGLAEQAERFEVPLELIMVEWNPPAGRPSLAEALSWPSGSNPSVRIITVPPALHSRLAASDQLPMFQMIAKNVGIRRAEGEFILATNIDILFPDVLFSLFGGNLDVDVVYRADRNDVDPGFDRDPSPSAPELRIAKPSRRAARVGQVGPDGEVLYGSHLTPSQYWRSRVPRLIERFRDGSVTPYTFWAAVSNLRPRLAELKYLSLLHTNACGDFTLMSRSSWHALRGYPEWEMFSWHLDSLLLYQALALGFRFQELPEDHAVIHLEHAEGWTAETELSLFEGLERRGIPYLSDFDLRDLAMCVVSRGRRGQTTKFNGPDWGLARESLPEAGSGPSVARAVAAAGKQL